MSWLSQHCAILHQFYSSIILYSIAKTFASLLLKFFPKTIDFAPWKRFLQKSQKLNRPTTHASYLWSINFQMVTLFTLKNVSVHWDQFTTIRSLKGKFLVYTNYLSSVWLVELILVYTDIFHCTQCNHFKVNLGTLELFLNVLKASYSKLGILT